MERSFGIGDIAVYIPRLQISLDTLIARYRERQPQWARTLARAARRTGQESLRFPEPWEDAATMAAQAAAELLGRMSAAEIASLRYLVVGTETGVDQAKPVAAHVQGMLQRAGYALPGAISTFDIQHACAGGAIGLASVGAMLQVSRGSAGRGIIVCTDEARYAPGSSAEITQGAAAVALLVEPEPRLLEIDFTAIGYASRDVDDFFRPLGSVAARVKGRFSIECYQQAVEEALLELAAHTDRDLAALLSETDLFALHVPFRSLPEETLAGLVERRLGCDADAAARFLAQRQFAAGTAPAAVVGNVYSGALFLSVAALLAARHRECGAALAGQCAVLVAYGSGNTALAFSARVGGQAGDVMDAWPLETIFGGGVKAPLADYDAWIRDYPGERGAKPAVGQVPAGCFYLHEIREDGYRTYRRAGAAS
jgi:hydroxymethylglutaryl-CoA synthase